MTKDELYFELTDGPNSVRVDVIEKINYDSTLDWDKNWLKTNVKVNAGAFSGQFSVDFMTVDFENFKHELLRIYDDLKGCTRFGNLDQNLELVFRGDGNGHFNIEVIANESKDFEKNELTFHINIDQTHIKPLVNQVDKIVSAFPIVGDLKIKNK
ncbi:MAG: hypothetical protein Q7W45_01995 [Bacteroidota bacterium]|nr:hypothetical protein [Bacteroidota bacterium]MDP3220996.1 hypothetical protein [Deltaproteobacteria bacterium]